MAFPARALFRAYWNIPEEGSLDDVVVRVGGRQTVQDKITEHWGHTSMKNMPSATPIV